MKNEPSKILRKHRLKLRLAFVLVLGLFIRLYLTKFGNFGDVSVFAEWGKRFWDLDLRNYYFSDNWYYSFPTYPPLSALMYGALYWLYEKRYILAEIHNMVKIIPSSFIIYFSKPVPGDPFLYGYGYFMLLKLPAILADLGISVVVYKFIKRITGNINRAFWGMFLYLFNPVSIFLSSVWGQTESLVAFFGLLSILLLIYGKLWLSLPFMFVSLFIKPTWALLLPLYIFLIFRTRGKLKDFAAGFFIVVVIFIMATYSFSGGNLFTFTLDTLFSNMLPSAKGTAMASVSAFNFYTIFYQIDKVLATRAFFGIPLGVLGLVFFVVINMLLLKTLVVREKDYRFKVVVAIFVISMGGYLFMTNMLERYFFASFTPLIIIAAVKPRKLLSIILINLILFANLIWAFYRRSVGTIDHLFSDNNFILIKVLSVVIVVIYIRIAFEDKLHVFRKK